MEKLEKEQQIISLGKALIEHFQSSDNNDQITRWMLHYIAELIVKSEDKANPNVKEDEQKCFESILSLWERKDTFPKGLVPFGEYEAILTVLKRIGSTQHRGFYGYNNIQEKLENEPEELKEALETILAIDAISKTLIQDLLSTSISLAQTENTKALLEASYPLENRSQDLEVVFDMTAIAEKLELTDNEIIQRKIKEKQDNLNRINALKESYEEQLRVLKEKSKE